MISLKGLWLRSAARRRAVGWSGNAGERPLGEVWAGTPIGKRESPTVAVIVL